MKTLDELLRDFLLYKLDYVSITVEQYKICLKQLNCLAGHVVTLQELDAELILSFMRHRKSLGKSPRTVNNARHMLLSLWRHAFRKKFTKQRPPDSTDLPKLKVMTEVPEAWSLEELNSILHACDNARPLPYWDHRTWRALIFVFWDTAHRLDSILSIKIQDIHEGYLTARKTKQNRETVHKLSESTLAAIERLPEHESGLVFPWPYKRRQIWREYRKILKAADLPTGRRNLFHKLRRSSATHLAVVAGVEAAEQHLDHRTPGLARSHYVDPRFMPQIKAADVLPRLGEEIN